MKILNFLYVYVATFLSKCSIMRAEEGLSKWSELVEDFI